MALMKGTGPFGESPNGTFNFEVDAPAHQLYWEPTPRKVKVVVDDTVIAESTDVKVLHETGLLPVYYFPEDHVRTELFSESEKRTHCPFKGDAVHWDLTGLDAERHAIAWSYPEPKDECPPIGRHIAFYWKKVDEWWEEAERVDVHARDPYHRVDAIESDRHVVVKVGGTTIAESTRPTVLFETGLVPRFYLPETHVDRQYLEESDTSTSCPYKGDTSRYYDVVVDGERIEDAAWVYDRPKPAVIEVTGKVAFFNEKVDLVVDGEPYAPPGPVGD